MTYQTKFKVTWVKPRPPTYSLSLVLEGKGLALYTHKLKYYVSAQTVGKLVDLRAATISKFVVEKLERKDCLYLYHDKETANWFVGEAAFINLMHYLSEAGNKKAVDIYQVLRDVYALASNCMSEYILSILED